MKKRVLTIVLTLALIVSMAIPASAATSAMTWNYSGFIYHTNDTCHLYSYYCVIESDSADYSLRTKVDLYENWGGNPVFVTTNDGYASRMISTTSGTHQMPIKQIRCTYFLNGIEQSNWLTSAE